MHDLLAGIRRVHDGDILVYSGFPPETLAPRLEAFQCLIDALIADPFDGDAPQSLALHSSDNQRLLTFTPIGEAHYRSLDRRHDPSDRHLDVMFDDETGQVWFAGIPGRLISVDSPRCCPPAATT